MGRMIWWPCLLRWSCNASSIFATIFKVNFEILELDCCSSSLLSFLHNGSRRWTGCSPSVRRAWLRKWRARTDRNRCLRRFGHPLFLLTLIVSVAGWWTTFIGRTRDSLPVRNVLIFFFSLQNAYSKLDVSDSFQAIQSASLRLSAKARPAKMDSLRLSIQISLSPLPQHRSFRSAGPPYNHHTDFCAKLRRDRSDIQISRSKA